MRYIDADEALKAMDTFDKFGYTHTGAFIRNPYTDDYVPYVHYEDMVKCVSNMPNADVVEVVRCRDCKHLRVANNDDWSHFEGDMYCYPRNMNCDQCVGTDVYWLDVNLDGYCKWGERREDEQIH